MITRRSRLGGASSMDSGRTEGGVPLSMIPLLEVAHREEEKDSQRGSWIARQEQEGKKRKRSSNWSEAETLQLLILRKGQLQNKDERKSCPKGSSAWDEIAAQLKEHKFTARSGKHVGERWDTLRRVYMDIEERCKTTKETYTSILDANRELFKFIPTEYTQRWHELIAECKPGKRRGKKPIESGNSQKLEPAAAPSVTSHRAPTEAGSDGNVKGYGPRESSPASGVGVASAFDSLIRDIELAICCQKKQDKSCGRKYARRGRDSDERAEPNGVELSEDTCDAVETNVVASLQSLLAALKSTSEFTSSESYLLKIDKREWNLVEYNMRAFSERHRNTVQSRINGTERAFSKIIWPPDDPDPVTITHDDIKTLEPGGQLSDNIVNFYLKYLHCNNTRIPDVQIFKTFTKNVSANLNIVRYGSVRHWVKSIFDKSYVIIPVYKEEQWSLVILCFPGRPLAGGKTGIVAPCILHLNPSRQKAHQDLERHMRFILQHEWLWHHEGQVSPPHIAEIPFYSVAAKAPQQENCADTGLLILQYAELLLKNGPETVSLAQSQGFSFLSERLESSAAMTMRTAIKQVLDMDVLQKQSRGG